MKHWLRLGLQLLSLVLFALLLLWGGPEAWRQVVTGDRTHILLSFMLLGLASIVSATRLLVITRSITGRPVASWSRFYYLNMTTRALGLIMPRSVSTIGGKSVALGTLGVSLKRAIWIVMLDNGLDVLLLGVLVAPALLFLRRELSISELLVFVLGLMLALGIGCWWLSDARRASFLVHGLARIPRLSSLLPPNHETVPSLLLPRTTALRAFGLSIVLNGTLFLCFYHIAQAVGLSHPWPVYAAGFPITQLSLIVAVTPGGLGIQDASWYGVLLLAGLPSQEALTFVIAQRAYLFLYVLILAGLGVMFSLVTEGRRHA